MEDFDILTDCFLKHCNSQRSIQVLHTSIVRFHLIKNLLYNSGIPCVKKKGIGFYVTRETNEGT